MAEETKKLTPSGCIQCPSYSIVAEWVKIAWDQVDTYLIKRSFKCCGISNARDGTEDNHIFDYGWVEQPQRFDQNPIIENKDDNLENDLGNEDINSGINLTQGNLDDFVETIENNTLSQSHPIDSFEDEYYNIETVDFTNVWN